MPTYVVTAPEGQLSQHQKDELAPEITRIHVDVARGPAFLAQVIFVDVKEGNYFMGGRKLTSGHVFVHGQIREGRSDEVKQQLLKDLMRSTARIAGLKEAQIGVYLVDVPAQQIAEYGSVLPKPGGEAAWLARLPPEIRERLQAAE